MEGFALVTVDYLVQKGGELKLDKNGEAAVILTAIAGKIPNKRTLSGTMAKRQNLEVGKLAYVQYVEGETNSYGRQFDWVNFGSPTMLEIGPLKQQLGSPSIINVSESAPVEEGEVFTKIEEPKTEEVPA